MGRSLPAQLQGAPAVGVIGAGAWGRNILRTLDQLGALAACADTAPAVCAEIGAQFPHIRCVTDYRELLADGPPAVAVATPAPTHFEVVRAALETDKDVFVEKPLTLDPVQAAALRALARERGRVLMVGHITLFVPAVRWIARYLASGALGRVRAIHQERLGFGRPRRVENALWCLGSHDLAVQIRLAGRAPHQMQVEGQCLAQPDVEDDVYLHLGYPGDLQTHLHVSWAWPERRRRLTVIGSAGMLSYDELAQEVTLHRKSIGRDLEPRDLGAEIVFRGSGQPLRAELQTFLQRVARRHAPPAELDLAVDVVRLLDAAEASLAARRATRVTAMVGGIGHARQRLHSNL